MNPTFQIRRVFHDAWFATKGIKGKFWPAIIANILLNVCVASIVLHFYPSSLHNGLPYAARFYVYPILAGLLTAPILGGLFFTALQRARHAETSFMTPFEGYRKIFSIAVAWFILNVIGGLIWNVDHWTGFAHLLSDSRMQAVAIGFGFLVSLFFMFTLPLILDKNLNPLAALAASFQYVCRSFGKIIGTLLLCYFFAGIIFFALEFAFMHTHTLHAIGVILLLLIAIWFIPFMLMVYGELYHRIIDAAPQA